MFHHLLRLFAVILFILFNGVAFADPPERVGHVSYMSGKIHFRADNDDEWQPASLNYPVTTGYHFATYNDSRLEIRVGSAAIRLDEDSEISIPRLDDDVIRIQIDRGVANVTSRSAETRYPIEVITRAGKVTLSGAGVYRFEASRDYDQTIIAALRGNAALDTNDGRIAIDSGRELTVDRIDPLEYRVRNNRQGPFEDWIFARDARIDRSHSVRYVSSETGGHEDLDEYGDWQETADYGAVWIPRRVARGWVPYRDGRWTWVEPWGWTWVDNAPWGFAPFHYGRWVYINNRWGWTPGVVTVRPVYAPALVAFVGRPGWNASFSFGSAPAVGWVPLGYHDLYRPSYPCSTTYVRNVNITNINIRRVDVTKVNWNRPPAPDSSLRRYPQAVTVVPQKAFTDGRPVNHQVAKVTGPINESRLRAAPPVSAPMRRIAPSRGPEKPFPVQETPQLRHESAPLQKAPHNPSQQVRIDNDNPARELSKRFPNETPQKEANSSPMNNPSPHRIIKAPSGMSLNEPLTDKKDNVDRKSVNAPEPPKIPTAVTPPRAVEIPAAPRQQSDHGRRHAHIKAQESEQTRTQRPEVRVAPIRNEQRIAQEPRPNHDNGGANKRSQNNGHGEQNMRGARRVHDYP